MGENIIYRSDFNVEGDIKTKKYESDDQEILVIFQHKLKNETKILKV